MMNKNRVTGKGLGKFEEIFDVLFPETRPPDTPLKPERITEGPKKEEVQTRR